jgi:hypothetical protein
VPLPFGYNLRMSRTGGLVLLAASVVACGPRYSKLKLDEIQNVAVGVDDHGQRFCAYTPVAVRVRVTYKDGKQVQSRVPGEESKGRLRTSDFLWSTSHGALDANAVLSLPRDPLAWFNDAIRVAARVRERPELMSETTLHPSFGCGGTLNLGGARGARGGEAEHGGPGGAGPDVRVAAAHVDTKHGGRLVLVRVQTGSEQPEYYVVDPSPKAPFVIDASGGAGGRGGQGVVGVAGRAGVDGQAGLPGVDCSDGMPGQDGSD